MKRSARTVAAMLVSVLLSASPARAEHVLSLDEALSIARSNNRDLKAARARLAETATNIELAWAALLPQLGVQGKYTHNYKNVVLDLSQITGASSGLANAIRSTSMNPAEVAALSRYEQALTSSTASIPSPVIQKGEQLDLTANATVPLLVPYAYGALRAAKLTQRSNESEFETTNATVMLSVAQAYFTAAGADELVVARRHAVEVATDTYETAKARVAAGFVNRVETTRAEVSLVRAGQDEAEAENARDAAYRSLATLLGSREPFRVQADRGEPPKTPPVRALRAAAKALRPEFPQYQSAIAAARANASSNAWRWAPTVSAFGNGRLSNYAGFAGDKYAWAVGAELDWTLYDGGTRDAQRHRAEAEEQENIARLELLRDTVSDEVTNASETLETKRRALDAAVHALELSRETLRLIRAQYEAGTAQQLDVLAAQDSLVSSEVSVARAHFDLALADLELGRAAGTFPPKRATQ
ncbi:MAG TPA: TolC family protein [Polyangiaceae bacterium]|nr:TolC family protein [Polyangiaceae bacterium]